jgi:hypothetical protein
MGAIWWKGLPVRFCSSNLLAFSKAELRSGGDKIFISIFVTIEDANKNFTTTRPDQN